MNNHFTNPKPDFNPNTMFESKSDINELSLQLALSVIGLTMAEFRTMDKNQVKRILHHCNHSERLAYEILLHHLDNNNLPFIQPTKVFIPVNPVNPTMRTSPSNEHWSLSKRYHNHNHNRNHNIDDAYDHWTTPKSNKTLLNNMVDDAYDHWTTPKSNERRKYNSNLPNIYDFKDDDNFGYYS
jgi:hypothetical protein